MALINQEVGGGSASPDSSSSITFTVSESDSLIGCFNFVYDNLNKVKSKSGDNKSEYPKGTLIGPLILKNPIKKITFKDVADSKLKKKVKKDVAEGSIRTTIISNYNPFYWNYKQKNSVGIFGINRGCTVGTLSIVSKKSSWAFPWPKSGTKGFNYLEKDTKTVSQLAPKPSLPNCVGWCYGRIKEIWGVALDCGYIRSKPGSSSVYQVKLPNGEYKDIEGQVKMSASNDVPSGNAVNWYAAKLWSNQKGFYKTKPEGSDNYRPLPGAVICWKNKSCGHVAFVEAVVNYGRDDEYIIISESAYPNTGLAGLIYNYGIKELVRYRKVDRWSTYSPKKKGHPYNYSGNTFRGFLYSPVCQLSTVKFPCEPEVHEDPDTGTEIPGYPGSGGEISEDMTPEEREQLDELIGSLSGSKVYSSIETNSKVRIEWVGNEKDDGSGKRVNYLWLTGTVQSIDLTKEYPYGVSVDGNKINGYFKREDLKII